MKRKYLLLILCVVLVVSIALAACNTTKEFEFDKYQESAMVLPTNVPASASEPSVQIHYRRSNSNDYKTWDLWLWLEGHDGSGGGTGGDLREAPPGQRP